MATEKKAKPVVFKAGQKVSSIKTGAVGKIIEVRDTPKGQWIDVNFGDAKNPMKRSARPSQIQKV